VPRETNRRGIGTHLMTGPEPECLEMAELWLNDRDPYDRRVREQQRRRWLAREREDEDEQARADYAEFLEHQDADLHRRSEQRQDQGKPG
jgi:hypothetical protein